MVWCYGVGRPFFCPKVNDLLPLLAFAPHRVMRHATKRGIVVVAGYPGADMRAGTLSQVLKQAGLTETTESGDGTN